MLANLDAATGDALRSFGEALHQAQDALQRDQQRLRETSQLLDNLTEKNNELRVESGPSSSSRQRRDALYAEKLKMSHHARYQREDIAKTIAHIRYLTEPHERRAEALRAMREELRVLRRQYGIRAAQVHTYVSRYLLPQYTVENFRAHLDQLRQARVADEEVLRLASLRLEDKIEVLRSLERTLVESFASGDAETETEASCFPLEGGDNAAADSKQQRASTVSLPSINTTEKSDGGTVGEEEAAAADGPSCAADAAELERISQRRAAQQTEHAAAHEARTAAQQLLESRRTELKKRVLLLCQEIEEADTAQQQERKAFHDMLNAAASGGDASAGAAVGAPLCQSCGFDLYEGLL